MSNFEKSVVTFFVLYHVFMIGVCLMFLGRS